MKKMTDRTYETTDLYLGSFLKACGLTLVAVERKGERIAFVFQDKPERDKLIWGFNNEGMVCANYYKNALQNLEALSLAVRSEKGSRASLSIRELRESRRAQGCGLFE
jgi:hypothetical protein